MADDARKSELIAELARARAQLTTHTRAVQRELDFGTRLKASVRQHLLPWIGGASLLGLVLTRLPRRKKVVVERPWSRKAVPQEKVVKAGLLLTVLKIVFDLVRPALTKWIAHRFTEYAAGKSSARR